MGLLGNKLLFWRMLTRSFFVLLRRFYGLLQRLIWKITGVSAKIAAASRPENYHSSVHVLDILLFHNFDPLQVCGLTDYILMHNRFESPKYIFDNDDVSLYTITSKIAIFVESAPKGFRMWKSEASPFLKIAQMNYGRRLLIVPLNVFHRMSEELGDPAGPLIFLFNTARCGSTLLNQILEYTGRIVALSEPDAISHLATTYRKTGDTEELRELTRDTVRWICKPYSDLDNPAYAIKIVATAVVALKMFADVFPHSKFLFMYRDPVKVAKSIYKISHAFPSLRLAHILGRLHASLTEKCVDAMGFSGRDFRVKVEDDTTIGMFVVVLASRYYIEFLRDGFEVAGVLYEDIIADPTFATKAILKYIGLPESLAAKGILGMEQDSQRNSPLSAKILSRVKDPEMTPNATRIANEYLKKYGMPLVGEDPLLPGTITRKTK